MSDVFQILTPHRPVSVSSSRLWCGGRTHSLGGEEGGGSILWKTIDIALYSTYVSTLWLELKKDPHLEPKHIIVVDLILSSVYIRLNGEWLCREFATDYLTVYQPSLVICSGDLTDGKTKNQAGGGIYLCGIIEQAQPTFCISSCFANGTKFHFLFC